jgi:hypothetical protein
MSWTPYFLERLRKAGVSVRRSWDATPAKFIRENEPARDRPYAVLWYNASVGEFDLSIGLRFEPSFPEVEKGGIPPDPMGFLHEVISLEWVEEGNYPGEGTALHIHLTSDSAHVDELHGTAPPGFDLHYITGIPYDARSVIDALTDAFVEEYFKTPLDDRIP